MINFKFDAANQLLLGSKTSEKEKNILVEMKNEFEQKFSKSGYFLIASSGSTQKINTSVKLIALPVQSVLNSAERFNRYFNTGRNDNWGLVLPDNHVAGLGIRARAFLTGAEVYGQEWNTETLISWIRKNKIKLISMVPAQIYDLVKAGIKAPSDVKKVFVGAGALEEDLQKQIAALGWPIIETYGMTETASMVAVKEGHFFKALPGVEIKSVEDDFLQIKCNSQLMAAIQKIDNQICIKSYPLNSWIRTEDLVSWNRDNSDVYFKFLGRKTEYLKILGEGVSLSELRHEMTKIAISKNLNMNQLELLALEDVRAGFKLVLVFTKPIKSELATEIVEIFNLQVRPYEKIAKWVEVGHIPRTELGKLKIDELKRIVKAELNKGMHGEY